MALNEAKLDIDPGEQNLSGLNLRQVLDAHTAWKFRLQQVLDGNSTEEMEVEIVSQDNRCVLGKWLYSEGKKLYGHLPEYESILTAHAEFHLCAGQVLMAHQDGNVAKASQMLNLQFRTASNKNQFTLISLFNAARIFVNFASMCNFNN